MFPSPHRSAEAVNQDDRRAGANIEICDPLIMNGNGFDRDTFLGVRLNVSK